MRYEVTGFVYEEVDFHFTEAIVTKDRIAIDWNEEGTKAGLVAHSTDGSSYSGNMGFPRPDEEGFAEFRLYKAKDGELVLLGKWWRTDATNGGSWLLRLHPRTDGGKSGRK